MEARSGYIEEGDKINIKLIIIMILISTCMSGCVYEEDNKWYNATVTKTDAVGTTRQVKFITAFQLENGGSVISYNANTYAIAEVGKTCRVLIASNGDLRRVEW